MKFYAIVVGTALGMWTLGMGAAAQADSSYRVSGNYNVSLSVGEVAIVHGTRGRCGKLPSAQTLGKVKKKLDRKLKTGQIQFGKAGVRNSGACKGLTPVYETLFVAERPGREQVEIHGNIVTIEVK